VVGEGDRRGTDIPGSQPERQAERQAGRQAERQAGRERQAGTERQAARLRGRQIALLTDNTAEFPSFKKSALQTALLPS
jgi:hypothetical protein